MPRINRGDPAYETAMREAKALFDAAMAKSAMKGRGRPAAAKSTAVEEALAEDVGVPGDVPDDIAAEIVKAGGDIDLPAAAAEPAPEPVPEPVLEPEAESAPAAKKRARKPRADKSDKA